MPETLFALDAGNYRNCQTLYRGEGKRDYYEGEFWVDDARPVDVRARKRECGPYSIIETSAATSQFFRRTRKHIREDATDLCVLWFVRHGVLRFSNQNGQQEIAAGQFLLTRSMSPFFIELDPGEGQRHEILHVTVPTHLLRQHLSGEIATSAALPGDCGEVNVARRILSEVFEDSDALSLSSCQVLVETACKLIGNALASSAEPAGCKRSLGEVRLGEVLRFIEIHLSDPNLCMAMVSAGCGVSQRYLSLLLQGTGQTFSELVWSKRLELARDWLSRADPRAIAISEIAYGVGFKSTAHFSRKFKRVFGVNPSDFRENVASQPADAEDYGGLAGATLQ